MSYSLLFFFHSGKFSKLRLTGLVALNVIGEKLPMFVNWKRLLTHGPLNLANCFYPSKSQAKNEMESKIFTSWVKYLDKLMIAEGRKCTDSRQVLSTVCNC